MKRFACVLLIGLLGCGKKSEPTPVASEPSAEPVASSPVATVPVTAAPEVAVSPKKQGSIEDELEGTVHPEMTMRLQMFVQLKGRLPQNFYELQNMPGFDSTPGLPPAFKYQIEPKDKTVRIVKK